MSGLADAGVFSPLGSTHWHRVADWRPRLRDEVRCSRVWSRAERWHVLHDQARGGSCRLNAAAYEIAARLDGRLTLAMLWAAFEAQADRAAGREPPSQDEILAVVRQLQRHGLLAFDTAAASLGLDEGAAPDDSARSPLLRNHLLAWRIPLGNPERLLKHGHSLGLLLFSKGGWWAWCAAMAALLAGLLEHGPALQAHGHAWMATPRYLLMAMLAYPLIKAVHEAAHALAVGRWGGSVREAGITLMLLMPVPYVDASAASGFARRRHRALVSAAGIMAELALATMGLWLWRWTQPGTLHDLGFVVWFTAGVSTLLFNANPLQRLDGYHVMTDALDLPNLATRSRQWWARGVDGWLTARQAGAQAATDWAPTARGERPWLILYAPLAWAYQVALWLGLTWWAGQVSAWLGALLAVASTWQLVVRPAAGWMGMSWRAMVWQGRQGGTVHRLRALALIGVPLLALLLPWPDGRIVQGVVWAAEDALIRPDVEGLVAGVHVQDGAQVRRGQALLTLHNPRLVAERERAAAQLAQAQQDQFSHFAVDSGKAGQAGDKAHQLQARLARLDEQLSALTVRARRDGRLILPGQADLPGRYLARGALLGHVVAREPATVRVAVDEADALSLPAHGRGVSVRLSDPGDIARPAVLRRDGLGAVHQLPSPALSQAMGGRIATDPQDREHRRTVRPVVLMDVTVAGLPADTARLGERAAVRFDAGWSPPLVQVLRWLSRQMRLSFNPVR